MFSVASQTKTDFYPKRDIMVSPVHLAEESKSLDSVVRCQNLHRTTDVAKGTCERTRRFLPTTPGGARQPRTKEEKDLIVGHVMGRKLSCEGRGGIHTKGLHLLSPKPPLMMFRVSQAPVTCSGW